MENQPRVERTGRYTFKVDDRQVDFSSAMSLPEHPKGLDALQSAVTGWLGNWPSILKVVNYSKQKSLEKLKNKL